MASAAPASLTERVMSYMKYKCDNETLKGIEQAAFHLHCSARQLQRILNQSEAAGLVNIKWFYGLYIIIVNGELICYNRISRFKDFKGGNCLEKMV